MLWWRSAENSKIPDTDEWMRTSASTDDRDEIVANSTTRVPVILPPDAYERWLANIEPDPRNLSVPYPSELMKIWPISTRVNKPENDDERSWSARQSRVSCAAVVPEPDTSVVKPTLA